MALPKNTDALNQQEEAVLDALGEIHLPMTAGELCRELRWSTAKLHPILAQLLAKRLIEAAVEKDYPYQKVYYLTEFR